MNKIIKAKDSICAKCRWFIYLPAVIQNSLVVQDTSIEDYQGTVNVITFDATTGNIYEIIYNYGSCSGCDGFEEFTVESSGYSWDERGTNEALSLELMKNVETYSKETYLALKKRRPKLPDILFINGNL